MDNIGYTSLLRQTGLMREMQSIANNISNASTTGFRREGVIFSEFVHALEGGEPSLSMARANARNIDQTQGALTQTGGTFDFAIEGPGYFLVGGPGGEYLTRAGSFTPSDQGLLVTSDGYELLDAGGAPIFVPPDAQSVAVSADGTLTANNRPLANIGLYQPIDPNALRHRDGVRFEAPDGIDVAIGESRILQGFVENSNVDPIGEIARMIDVQRSYELGQQLLEREDARVRAVIETVMK